MQPLRFISDYPITEPDIKLADRQRQFIVSESFPEFIFITMLAKLRVIALFVIPVFINCGIYSFSGSTLPADLKTVDIPLFVNATLQSGVAEDLTSALAKEVVTSNLLRVVTRNGDATISGRVTDYANTPYTYGNKGVRDVDVSSYAVRISVAVEFMNNKSSEPLYKGTVSGQGIYNFATEREDDGRTRAMHDIVQQIIQNSVKSW